MKTKRITALAVSAMYIMSIAGCSDKKPEDITPESEPVVVRELNLSNAEEIEVPVQVNRDEEAPVDIRKVDVSYLNGIIPEELEFKGEKLVSMNIFNTIVEGETAYIQANISVVDEWFDQDNAELYSEEYWKCYHSDTLFESSGIYSIDLNSGEWETLSSKKADDNIYYYELSYYDGYLYSIYDYLNQSSVMTINCETGEENTIYTCNKDNEHTTYVIADAFIRTDGYYIFEQEYSIDNETTKSSIKRYDIENAHWETVESSSETDLELSAVINATGEDVYANLINEDDKICVSVEDAYNLHTDFSTDDLLNGFTNVYANENFLSWVTNVYNLYNNESFYHRYDAQKEIIYNLDLSSYSGVYLPLGNGLFIGTSSLTYYLLPEIGMIFLLTDYLKPSDSNGNKDGQEQYSNFCRNGDTISFMKYKTTYKSTPQESDYELYIVTPRE